MAHLRCGGRSGDRAAALRALVPRELGILGPASLNDSQLLLRLKKSIILVSSVLCGRVSMADDDSVEGKINAVANLAKAVPIYEDAVQPIAQQTGKALGTVGELVNAALLPAKGLIWGAEQIKVWLQERVEKKLERVKPEDLVSPNLSIAGPTIEALKFRGYDAEISEMFANLLANDMIKDNKPTVHPTFVETIKEITPLEARLFASAIDFGLIPVAGYAIKTKGRDGDTLRVYPFNEQVISNANIGRTLEIDDWQVSIENMERLGLLRLDTDSWYTSDKMKKWYEDAAQHPIALEIKDNLSSDQSLVVKKGRLIVTRMGENFSKVALKSP